MLLIESLRLHRSVMHDQSVYNQALYRKSKYKIPYVLFLCFFVFLAMTCWFLFTHIFVVKEIQCTMDNEDCPESVFAEVSRLQKTPLLFLETLSTKMKLMGALPQLQSVEFKKLYPHTLKINLLSSQESLVVYLPEMASYVFLSPQGKVLNMTPVKPERTLYISIPSKSLRQGDEVFQQELQDIIRLKEVLKNNASILSIEYVNSQDIRVYLPNNKHAVISSDGLEKQVNTLQLLLNEATMIENISVMDLRFSHPVLR